MARRADSIERTKFAVSKPSVYCRTSLNYSVAGLPVAVEADILDGRTAELPGWNVCGFELMKFPSAVTRWDDRREVEAKHFDEVAELVRTLTGCEDVVFYPPVMRSPEAAGTHPDFSPIEFVHSDYTESYGPMIGNPDHPYHRILEPSIARADLPDDVISAAARILTLQLWRNIGRPDIDRPICFCDCRTVPRAQLTPVRVAEYGGLRTEFDAFSVAPPERDEYRWYTFPDMTPDEVVVFRAFDSRRVENHQPFWTPHSSFRDPCRPADAPARRSVEMRAICLFH
jgi:hypothetical protein